MQRSLHSPLSMTYLWADVWPGDFVCVHGHVYRLESTGRQDGTMHYVYEGACTACKAHPKKNAHDPFAREQTIPT